MKRTVKAAVSGMCAVIVSAGVLVSGAGAVAVSTDDIKTDFDATEVLSQRNGLSADKAVQDYVFDGNQRGGKGNISASAVRLNFTIGPSNKTAVTQAKRKGPDTIVPPRLKDQGLSDKSGVKQKSLGDLVTSPDGNMYRVVKESPWWKFWDSSRAIQKAAPDEEGNMWNGQGEYVGGWETVLKTKAAANLEVVKGSDGQDHLYTREGYNKVYRDGKYVTTFSNSILSDASLKGIKAGADDKVYAQYTKNAEDIIMKVDPLTKKQDIAARVPAEIREWTSLESREVYDYTDSNGDSHYRTEYYTERHVDRSGVDKFGVAGDGRVFTLFKGNVFEEGARGDRKLLAGSEGHWYTWNSPIENVPAGNVGDFSVDTYGNLYSVQGGRVVVNNNALSGLDLGWQNLRIDDSGNVYRTEDRFLDGTYLTRTSVLPDAANADRIAAPDAGV